MKNVIIIILVLFSCKPVPEKKADNVVIDSVSHDSVGSKKNAEIEIGFENGDTLRYTKYQFEAFRKYFPNLTAFPPKAPDEAYKTVFVVVAGEHGKPKHISFGSESGQDEFYLLYTFFLRNKLQSMDLSNRRTVLNDIFQNINAINGKLNFGGTFFGHQYKRIPAYTEYALYEYNKMNKIASDHKFYPDKKAFIDLFQKHISEQLSNETYFNEGVISKTNMKALKKDLQSHLDKLNELITDRWYMEQARKFQEEYYQLL